MINNNIRIHERSLSGKVIRIIDDLFDHGVVNMLHEAYVKDGVFFERL